MKKIILSIAVFTAGICNAQDWELINNTINGDSSSNESGFSVSLNNSGSIVAIGAPFTDPNDISNAGQVRVFQNANNEWSLIGTPIEGTSADERLGGSVSLNSTGTILAVGAPLADGTNKTNSGKTTIYSNNNGTWTQIGDSIEGVNTEDRFGSSVSISDNGNFIAIGAPGDADIQSGNGTTNGTLSIFENVNNTWVQVGNTIEGESLGNLLGVSVSINGNGTIVGVGEPRNSENGNLSGKVQVFEFANNNWSLVGNVINGAVNSATGISVALNSDGTILAIGGLNADARVYKNENNSWNLIGDPIISSSTNPFGGSVSLNSNGTIVAIGAPGKLVGSNTNAGQVRVFENDNDNWVQTGQNINSNSLSDQSGRSVSLNDEGTIVAIGTPGFDDGNTENTGQVKILTNDTSVLSIDDISLNNSDILFFPNPSTDIITLVLDKTTSIKLFDLKGSLLQSKEVTAADNILDVSALPTGTYILNITSGNNTISKRIVKK